MNFYDIKPESWKIIYKVNNSDSLKTKPLVDKIKKFTSERTSEKLRYSEDIYTMTEGFVVIHGIPSEQKAIDIVSILKDYKDYKILETAIVISNENYKIVQIKKNLQDYLITPKTDPIGIVPYVPKQSTPSIEKPVEKNNEKVQNEILKLKNPTPPQPSGKNLNIQDSDDPVPANQSSAPTKIDKLPQAPPKRP